ncbi:MAG: 16S rRNA (cytosine(967)-C(5))-methyltransferase RsmB [Nitrospira sp.]
MRRYIKVKRTPPSARKGALFLLAEAEESREDLSFLIDRYLQIHRLEQKERGLLTELVYGIFRQRTYLDWQIDHFSKVRYIKAPIRNTLRLGLYQLIFLDKVPSFAAVDTSVELSKGVGGISASRLVNGLLRTVLRQKDKLPAPDPGDPISCISITYSHPAWMVRRWINRWGQEKTTDLCRSNNTVPPMTLRVNLLKTDRKALIKQLEEEGATVTPSAVSPVGIAISGVSLRSLPSYSQGRLYVQDEGAQLISNLVDPQNGDTILDVCAAPGGKTTHLAELMLGKGQVVATDIDPDRMALVRENIKRLQTPGVSAEAPEEAMAPEREYDRILVDAPCSALGILRRIPEGKWRKRPETIESYAKIQRAILEKAFHHLKVGGRLIYATCSTEPEENEEVVEAFFSLHPELKLEDPSEGLPPAARKYLNEKRYFTTLFNSDRMDRFFAVRWIRTA